MARADSLYTDLGIVYYKDLDPSAKTYVDKTGETVDCEELTTDFTAMAGTQAVKTATHHVGIAGAHSYWVYVNMAEAEGVAIVVRLVSQYGNDAGGSPHVDDLWARVQVVNQDNGTTANEHTLSASGIYLLQTASEHTTGTSRWECKVVGSPETALVRIAGRCV